MVAGVRRKRYVNLEVAGGGDGGSGGEGGSPRVSGVGGDTWEGVGAVAARREGGVMVRR